MLSRPPIHTVTGGRLLSGGRLLFGLSARDVVSVEARRRNVSFRVNDERSLGLSVPSLFLLPTV
jgi:hypothetical protein